MAATTNEILTYLTDIKYAQSEFMDKLNRKERLGHKDLYPLRLRSTILGYYVTIMVDYFSQDAGSGEYASNNFFTTTEIEDIINRINRICDSNYEIEL
jgi:hypothetical protein